MVDVTRTNPTKYLTRKPIAIAVHNNRMLKQIPAVALSLSVALGSSSGVYAADADAAVLEEVVVSARKRDESLQDAPLSIQAINSTALKELGITSFENYALMLPSLSYQTAGPGLSQIYMRGASDGGDGNASGQSPSVAVYLDEQPVTAIGRNLDIHIYDIARVEALAGPQGTLFGASSQGGTLRIITNKPSVEEFEAGFDVGYADTKDGKDSYSAEAYVNQPLGDAAALRVVAWKTKDGGYIDNIAGTRTYALFDAAGNTNLVTEDNNAYVEDDFNELNNKGARAALKIDLNENWSTTAGFIYQKNDTDGVWFHDPDNPNGEVGDLEIQRFNDDSSHDEFKQYSLTVEGDLGFASLTYAGAYMDRDVEYNNDYSEYADYYSTSWIQYYSCNYYEDPGPATAQCTSNNIFYEEDNSYDRQSHEVRLQSQGDSKFQYITGLYYEDATHKYRQEWIQPGMAQGPQFNQFVPNWTSTADSQYLWYLTDQKREDKQYAVFGEFSYDITDDLTGMLGGRYFKNESSLKGVSGYGVLAPGFPALYVDEDVDDKDSIFKANLNYSIIEDKNIYFTWSQGYRPGGLNRDQTPLVNIDYKPDHLTNWEFGWKTTWMDQRLRWNGAAYFMQWEDMQFTKFDSSFGSPVGLTLNIGDAEIKGLESDITFIPAEGWTLSAAVAFNNAELSKDFVIGGNSSPSGTELPFVPEWKYNLNARYEFNIGEFNVFAQAVYAYVGDSYNDIFKYTGGDASVDTREEQADYDNINLTTGIDQDGWGVDLYVYNLTDERAELTRSSVSYDTSITTNRPRTIGIKYRMRF